MKLLRPAHVLRILPLALLLLVGCDDDSHPARQRVEEFPPATTPDQVVENLVSAYVTKNFDRYNQLLHEDFEFQFSPSEFDLSGAADGRWDRLRDSISTERMFEGAPTTYGEIVQSIDMSLAPENDELPWSDEVEPEFDGALRRIYRANMGVTIAPGATTYQVRTLQEFYVLPVEIDGVELYRLRFWREHDTNWIKAGTESASIGAVKAAY